MTYTEETLNFGTGLRMMKWSIGAADLQATSGSGAQTFNLTGPGGSSFTTQGIVLGVRVTNVDNFAGGAISAMTVSVGKAGGTATFFTAAYDVFAVESDTTVQETALFKGGQRSAFGFTAVFTPTGANASVVTQGQVDIHILLAPVTVPGSL